MNFVKFYNFRINKFKHCKRKNINNYPNKTSLDNILELIFYCLQPIRNYIKKPIIITSGYRSKEINKLVKGRTNSQHLKGQAADFIVKGMDSKKIIDEIIKSKVIFDQLIDEKGWVHISFNKKNNRKMIIKK